jgi:thiol-disulfide isomerase/thioredoxin
VEGLKVAVKRNFDLVLMVVLVVALVLGASVALRGKLMHFAQDKENAVTATAGEILPEAAFFTDSDQRKTLADFKGQVVLVNLWATWCPPCIVELPALDSLQAKLKDRNFKVIAIAMDQPPLSTVTAFLQGRDITHLDVYWDKERQIPLKWRYDGLPVSFLIDAEGHVVHKFNGPQEWDKGAVFAKISSLLKK